MAANTTPSTCAARRLLRAAAVSLLVLAAGVVGAIAVRPDVAVAAGIAIDGSTFVERNGEYFTGPTPTFDGTAEPGYRVIVAVYDDTTASEGPTLEATPSGAGAWTVGPVQALPDGAYTVTATQMNTHGESIEKVNFMVDANAPQVTLASPANGSSAFGSSQALSGSAGTAEGDEPAITVHLFAGPSIGGAPVRSPTADAVGGSWSAVLEGLSPGTYTAQAEQRDDVGNIGRSGALTFTLAAAPPAASFKWIPAAPHAGEPVTLVSTSTDASGPLTAFAWALAGNGVFGPDESALLTSFSTAGAHLVQLRVTDAGGLSSTVAETIPVSAPAPILMQPFPVVRIVGTYGYSGADIRLLTVLAPIGATVRVTCHGDGCSTKHQRLVATAGAKHNAGAVLITFHRFERRLQAGAVLHVSIYRAGQVGKFTRFLVRRGELPSRTDECLSTAGAKPIVCPL